MTPEAIEGWRIRARSNPLDFARWMFKARKGMRWELAAHHHAINAALLRVYAGEIRRLIINIPPRYSKTESVVNFMAWALGQYPDSEFIYSSYSARLSAKSSYDCREVVAHPEYRAIFPHVSLRDDSTARDEWRTTAGGMVYAVGAGGTITGYGAGKARPGFGGMIVIDDPHKADEATSQVMRDNVWDWFQGTMESRTNSPDTPIVVIMQRLHEDDLAGRLLAGANGEEWTLLSLPAIRADGTALWPFKHTIERLRQMEEANPYGFAGQYLQRPAPPAGGVIKPDLLGIVDAVPVGTHFCRAWDLASSVGKGDYTVGAKIGRCPDGSWIIADIVRFQGGPDEVRRAMLNTAHADGKNCPISIPQDPGQAGKVQASDLTRMLGGFMVEATPESGDKITRAQPFAAQVNAGNIKALNGPWIKAWKDEARLFPFGKNDDQIDACSRAFAKVAAMDTWISSMYDGMRREESSQDDRQPWEAGSGLELAGY